jgi:carbamoyltransferase
MIVLGFSGIANGEEFQRRYGLRFVGHDAAVALVVDGEVVFAVEEERLSRRKHTSAVPVHAVRAALDHTGLRLADVDGVAYPWAATPGKLAHMLLHHATRIPPWHWPELAMAGARVLQGLMSPSRAIRNLERALGARCEARAWSGVAHHLAHAACAFYTSPFQDSAVLTVDAQGEDESASLGEFSGSRYRKLQSIWSPHSIGIVYALVTDYLGMRSAWDEYKVMAMASMGDPARFRAVLNRLVRTGRRGSYHTHRTAMVFKPGYCDALLAREFGVPKRDPGAPLEQRHFDIAAALQDKTEQVLFHLLDRLRARTSSPNLCLAGGVFQNSVANGKILASGLFERVHVPAAPGDHGAALGAALWLARGERTTRTDRAALTAFLGPGYSDQAIGGELRRAGDAVRVRRPADLEREVAVLLARGAIVAWFQGRAEYGPRALGHRSILAEPRRAETKDLVNARIKHREPYRPFAAAVPVEVADQWFVLAGRSPFMQFVAPVRADAQARLAAVTHAGTCRVQTVDRAEAPRFHRLLVLFGAETGVPVLLNTSFNDADEPIVCSPADALRTFLASQLDALAIGPFLVSHAQP